MNYFYKNTDSCLNFETFLLYKNITYYIGTTMDEFEKNSTNFKGGNRRGRPKKDANAKSKEVCISKEDQATFAKFAQEDAKSQAVNAKSRNANAKSARKNANPKVANADQKEPSGVLPTFTDMSSDSSEHSSVDSNIDNKIDSNKDSKPIKETEDELIRKAQALAEFTFWNCVTDKNGNYIPLMPPDLEELENQGLTIDIIANGIDSELLDMVIQEINKRLEELKIEGTLEQVEDCDLDLEQNEQKDDLDLEQTDQTEGQNEVDTSGDPIIPKFK